MPAARSFLAGTVRSHKVRPRRKQRSAVDVPRPAGVTLHEYVDYARDLPRFDAVVHHGGAGVLGHTLAAGLFGVLGYDMVRLMDSRYVAMHASEERLQDQPPPRREFE